MTARKAGVALAVLAAGTFALGALAQMPQGDKTASPPVDEAKMKADRDAAKAAQANMTPEQKAAAKKAKRAKKHKELSHMEKTGTANAPARAEAMDKSVEATKNDPKPLPDTKAKQDALKAQEKKASGQ
ncbi:MAG TPA: hypothetical protein VMN79_09535 [Casimicrobiaceae bacterium]|nr:hypothetical protein [Casimicrobiaceae bacterium]